MSQERPRVRDELGTFNAALLLHGAQKIEFFDEIPPEGEIETTGRIGAIWDKGKGASVDFVCDSTFEVRDRKPDHEVRYETRVDQPLLYRLSGDRNPLHFDPSFATMSGFDRPILHGLCTYGFTGRALLHSICGSDPARFKSMEARSRRASASDFGLRGLVARRRVRAVR